MVTHIRPLALVATFALLPTIAATAQPLTIERCRELADADPRLLPKLQQRHAVQCMIQQSGGAAAGVSGGPVSPVTPGATYGGWYGAPLLGERR